MQQLAKVQGKDIPSESRLSMNAMHGSCRRCGLSHNLGKGNCPAKDSQCDKCKITGHWAAKCFTRKQSNAGHNSRSQRRGDGTQPNERRQSRNRRATTPRRRGRSQRSRRSIHNIGTDSSGNSMNTNPNSDQFNDITFNSVDIAIDGIDHTSKPLDNAEAYTTVKFKRSEREGKTAHLKVKIDTGAMGNTLPLRTFSRIWPNKVDKKGIPISTISAPYTRLFAYNDTEIKHYGAIKILLNPPHSEEWVETTFFVVDTEGPIILGLPSLRELQLVTIHCSIASKTQGPINNIEDLKRQFPDGFDRIGNFPGEAHIYL